MIFPYNPSLTGPTAIVQVLDAMLWGLGDFINKHLPSPLGGLFWNRVRRLGRRFTLLAEMVRAGTLKPPRPRQAGKRVPSAPARPLDALPRQRGWVLRMGRHVAGAYRYELQRLLTTDAEIMALIAAEPRRCGRILRPLLWMLDIRDMPEVLRLPPRTRTPRPRVAPGPVRDAQPEPPPMPPPPPSAPQSTPPRPQPQAGWAYGSFDPVVATQNAFSPFRRREP